MQFNGLRSYILDTEFKVTILDGRINIVNFSEMGHFDNNKVIVRYLKNNNTHNLIIKGRNLVVSKLKSNEVLIEGVIDNLEFR